MTLHNYPQLRWNLFFGTMIKYEINEMPYAKKYDFKLVF